MLYKNIKIDLNPKKGEIIDPLLHKVNTYLNKNKNVKNKLGHIKFSLYNFITEYADAKYIPYFTDEQIWNLVNYATLDILVLCFKNSVNAKQTIYSFSRLDEKPYRLKDEKKEKIDYDVRKPSELQDAREKSITNGIQVWNENIALRKEQVAIEYPNIKIDTTTTSIDNGYNFIALCFADAYAENKLTLYKLLYLRKKSIYEKAKNLSNEKRNLGRLKNANFDFISFIEEILNSNDTREFVIKSLFLYDFEKSHKLLYALKLTNYILDDVHCNSNISSTVFDIAKRSAFITKKSFKNNRNNKIINLGKQTTQFQFIASYDIIIKALLNENQDLPISDIIDETQKVIKHAVNTYIKSPSTKDLYKISKEDFEDIKHFLVNDFKIIDTLKALETENSDIKLYKCFKYIYSKIVDEKAATYGQKILKKLAEIRNKKHLKK